MSEGHLRSSVNSSLRWLHISDLHVGKKNESQQTALVSMVAAIEQYSNSKPFDLVLLTGDLAYSGLEEEYKSLEQQLIEPLKSSPLCKNSIFVAVPGNHDLDCNVGCPISWNNIGTSRQEAFFHSDESGKRIRNSRASAFSNYSKFVDKLGIISVDPTMQPASFYIHTKDKQEYVFISLVTSFFSDKEVSDRNKAPAPVLPVRKIVQELTGDKRIIILGHHPIDWFTTETDRHFHSLLVENNALYLHGHEHTVKPKFGGRGLLGLGFGAGYQAPSESLLVSYYRNSFAICELEDSLHVSVTSWDAEHGQWRPDLNLPGDFEIPSDQLENGYCLTLPITRLLDQSTRPYASIATAIRSEFHVDGCIWFADNDPKRWTDLLLNIGLVRNKTETYALPTQTLPSGHIQFRVKDQSGQYLVRAVSGHGDILHYEQLQAINTELDKQDFDGSFVVTLGTLSDEARTLATQLELRKSITVLERTELVRRTIRNLPPGLEKALSRLDPNIVDGTLVITQSGYAMSIQEKTTDAWFYVINGEGKNLMESDTLVCRMREELPHLKSLRYKENGGVDVIVQEPVQLLPKFERGEYLAKSYAYFDEVKYAPLAALGLRFRKASLSEIYVDASADVAGSSKTTQNLVRTVTEFLDSLSLPKAQRDQLESQLRQRYGLDRPSEVGAARQLYQRFNNVIVLGDPGSGKTCFIKHEILAYCQPPPDQASWYSSHLPIFLSLAEAARLSDGSTDLLEICTIVSSRRGISLPKIIIEKMLSEGKVAFFFDGLDEVGFLDKRIALMSEIDRLVKTFAPRGNRFVLASRPAAVQPVDIPEAFTYLHLRGLTEEEIGILAGRVLTVRLGEEDEQGLTHEERDLIDRLLEDTRNSPGIARISRNPLLLTLLVLIYANTGAISARRHLIYTQAIKTLVSVRGRQTREQQISEADLRTRLGALAVAVFCRKIAEIPRRSEVLKILGPIIFNSSESLSSKEIETTNAFIQEVAEATGLLIIHSKDHEDAEDLITFMHYSFLEYYAAAGLLTPSYAKDLAGLSSNSRWKDVMTLLFGILSEQGDVTPLLKDIITDQKPSESISKYRLTLALDCAAECDVPPEATQDLLADTIYNTVALGAGRYSGELRGKIAERIEYFMQGGGPRIEKALIRGLSDRNPLSAAAFADLIARMGNKIKLSKDLVDSFQEFLTHTSPVARAAGLYAIERCPQLRNDKSGEVILSSLSGSIVEKHAALKVINAVPSYHTIAATKLQSLLDDPNELISSSAAQCMLVNAFEDTELMVSSTLQEKVLAKLDQSDHETVMSLHGITLDQDEIERIVFSDDSAGSELAIRYLPLVQDSDQFVYKTIMSKLKTTPLPRHKAACLDSLRACPRAIDLITIADTDLICSSRKAGERNVRLAALKLLGAMPDDEQVVANLRDHLTETENMSSRGDEAAEAARGLARHVQRNPRLRNEVLEKVLQHLTRASANGFGDEQRQSTLISLLSVCENIGGVGDLESYNKLFSLATDYRTPINVRKQCIRVIGRITEPGTKSMEDILKLLLDDDQRLNDSIFSCAHAYVLQCRKKVEYVRRVYAQLPLLRDRLCEAWDREVGRSSETINPPKMRDIRNAVVEIESLITAYDEFSGRAQLV